MGNGFCDREGPLILPDTLLFEIFSHLGRFDLKSSSEVCQQWWRVSKDQMLWKKLLFCDFKLNPATTTIAPCSQTLSWYDEYHRIIYETPLVLSQVLNDHTDEVLHVAFAHNGSMFSTCSKDCTFKIWDSNHPCQLIQEENLRDKFHWKYTQFSQFNADDRLLLVSGVHFGEHTTTGEIAVFEITSEDLFFRCRVVNKPYDVFGCWFSPSLLVNGELTFFRNNDNTSSCSSIWLCRASQELHSVKKSVMAKLFKFYNYNASTVRMVLVSKYVSDWVRQAIEVTNKLTSSRETGEAFDLPAEVKKFRTTMDQVTADAAANADDDMEDFFSERKDSRASSSSFASKSSNGSSQSIDIGGDKLLMFSTGTQTYTPHQIGFKLVKQATVEALLKEETLSSSRLSEVKIRIRQMKEAALQRNNASNGAEENPALQVAQHEPLFAENNFNNAAYLQANFDFPDHLIDMRGHIIGLSLSNDERYLYVNVRPWPDESIITNPWEPPPIAQQIEIRVIDLEKLILLPNIYRGHKGFTPNDECFFIFLDACEAYVASGSEDKFTYLWDRHYNVQLGQLPHDGVVNSVAFNPKSAEMLVSVSDDQKIKIWRSKKIMSDLNIKLNEVKCGSDL